MSFSTSELADLAVKIGVDEVRELGATIATFGSACYAFWFRVGRRSMSFSAELDLGRPYEVLRRLSKIASYFKTRNDSELQPASSRVLLRQCFGFDVMEYPSSRGEEFCRISSLDNIGIDKYIDKYLSGKYDVDQVARWSMALSGQTAAMYSTMGISPELLGQAIDNLGTKETIEEAKPVDRFAAVVQEMKDI